jgi:pyruvate dehydrogenase (quinone)
MARVVAAYMAEALPQTSLGQAHGFGLFMPKAVMNDRAGELIDLAKVNLLR